MSQTVFRRALLDPEAAVPAGMIDPQGRPAGRRFDVYRNNVAFGLSDALANYFPVTKELVGEDFFRAMTTAFLRQHPPTSPVLIRYGAELPGFIAGFAPAQSVPYLAEVARLELALRDAYHAADAVALPPDRFAALAPDDLGAARLTFAPAVTILRSDWPVHSIWAAHQRNAPRPTARTAQDVLILRPEFDPEPHLLSPGAADVIEALVEGQRLADALDAARPETDIPAILGLLIGQGAITGLTTGQTE
ncbi:MAG: hypothetical protein RLZZ528_2660 [Pseudomonadota bacterium]